MHLPAFLSARLPARIAALVFAASILALSACSSGPVRRVSEPTASIQQLSVRADGQWDVQLRLQNYSSVPMRFDRTALALAFDNGPAARLDLQLGIDIGPESADVVSVSLQPTPLARIAVADALAGRHGLAYTLKGSVEATPEDKKPRSFEIDSRNQLNPAPGLDGVLR